MTTRRDIPLWLPFVLALALIVALYHRLFSGETLFWGLPTLQFYPWREFAFEQLRAGHLPASNPYLGAGAPLFANYQTAVAYPPNWLWLVLPGTLVMSVVALLHIAWAWLGMWFFAGALGFSRWGRAVSAFAYAFSGYLIARLGSFPTADAGAWLPWLFWLVLRVLRFRRVQDAGWLALAFGLHLLAGHAQTAWYGAVALGLFALWIVVWDMRGVSLAIRVRALGLAGVGLVLGLLIAAIQLLPTAEYLAESQRSSGLDYDTLANLSYHPIRLLTLLSPDFLGTPADGSYLTEGIYFEDAAYIGLIPLIAAFAALWAWLRQLRTHEVSPDLATIPFWTLLTLLGFFFAMGKYSPVFRTLYDTVPTFDIFREPVRWLILPVLALAVMAGAGVEHWGRGPRIVFWSRLSAAGGGAMAVMALAGLSFGDFSRNLEVLSWGMVVLGSWMTVAALLTLIQPQPPLVGNRVVWRSAVLVFIVLDLGWMARGLNPTVPDSFYDAREVEDLNGRIYWFDDHEQAITFGADASDDISDVDGDANGDGEVAIEGYFDVSDYRIAVDQQAALRTSLLPNLTMLDRVPAFSNNDPLLPVHYSAYRDLVEELGSQSGSLLRAAGVGQVFGIVPDGWEALDGVTAHAPYGARSAWLVPGAIALADDSQIEAALRDPAWNPLEQVILAGESSTQGAGEVGSDEPGEVALVSDDPDERLYHVTANMPAYLVIAETWYPGWSVTVNGQDAALYRANLAFMAVAMPEGESDIVLSYHISNWRTGVAVTVLAGTIVLALLVMPPMIARRRSAHD